MKRAEHEVKILVRYSKDELYEAVIRATEHLQGFSVGNTDAFYYTVSLKSGSIVFTRGQNVEIRLMDASDDMVEITINSKAKYRTLKMGVQLYNEAKNKENISLILNAIADELNDDQIRALATEVVESKNARTNLYGLGTLLFFAGVFTSMCSLAGSSLAMLIIILTLGVLMLFTGIILMFVIAPRKAASS